MIFRMIFMPILKRSFLGDVIKISSATTFGLLISIFTAPIISRLYLPTQFGISAFVASISVIFGVFVTLQYELAIQIAEKDEDAVNILVTSVGLTIFIGIVIIPVLLWLLTPILSLLNGNIQSYLWLIPFSVCVIGIQRSLNQWNYRKGQFGLLAKSLYLQYGVISLIQVGLGIAGVRDTIVLISAGIIGSLCASVLLLITTIIQHGRLLKISINRKKILDNLLRYKKFPIFKIPSEMLNSVSMQLPTILMSLFFPAETIGYYSVSNRLLSAPMGLLGSSLGSVFYQRGAEAKNDGSITNVVTRMFHSLIVLGLFPMFALVIIGKEIIVLFLGPQWAEAGIFTQILSPWVLVYFLSTPFLGIIYIYEKQEIELVLTILNIIAWSISLTIGGLFGNARIALLLISFSGVLIYGYLTIRLLLFVGMSRSDIINILARNLSIVLPLMFLLLLLEILIDSSWILIIVTLFLWFIYLLVVIKTDSEFMGILRMSLSR